MTPTEEKAQAYAEKRTNELTRFSECPPRRNIECSIEQAYLAGANDILALPLSERLTEEEKEKIRGFYDGETFGELDFIELISCRRILVSLLGSDFFKEGGNDGE